ncbi:hypothetical protein N865_01565 [Intrasporangium oryzae NRRL B-24470]|uniref:Uncharacterized protein n=1 Tax=Intrasporangium oryzae NRRL B-24470 TaxID=1386089 RepID=W9GH52_9MICO|nr:hypothetical protein N865_01565 [Intrasporangium oryzae NRRL B-24470]
MVAQGEFSNATRYLCAAAYLDSTFMRRVLEEVLYPAHRGVAPSYGIDVAPIARHCLTANKRVLARDGVICLLLTVLVVCLPSDLALLVLALYGVVLLLRLLTAFAARDFSSIVGTLVVLLAAGLLLLLNTRVQASATPSLEYVLDPNGGFQVAEVGGSGVATTAIAVTMALAVVGVLAWHRISVHATVVNELQRERFSTSAAPEEPRWARRRLSYLDHIRDSNVTVFSESVTTKPFVGSGDITRAWSFAIPLREATGTFVPSPLGSSGDGGGARPPSRPDGEFSALVLYDRLRRAIAGLATADLPENERLQALSIRDRLYVSGMLPETSPYLDPDSHLPVTRVDWDHVLRVASGERGPERHYQVTRISAWEGEVEVSVFIYTAVQGSMLFLELVATVLPSIKPVYHEIDAYEKLNGGVAARCVGSSVLDLVRVAPMSPVHLAEYAVRALTRTMRARQEERSISDRLSFDYGARMSVRELGARQSPVFFQNLDAEQRVALVERRVVASVVDTLEEFGLDPQEFGSRVMNLYNSTLISNSSVQNSALASGSSPMSRIANFASNASHAARTNPGSPS